MKAPLVSVALATWNGERFLREQLETIYTQTWKPLEVVVSDDASTDGTVSILDRYARSHGLRYFVNPEQKGLVKNFEQAISMASGDYIALSDQDDLWKPHKITTLVESIGDATLIYGNVGEVLDVDGRRGREHRWEPIFRFARNHGSGNPTRYLMAENWVVSHSILFKRQLVEHALPIPAHQRFHDGWLALIASKLAGVVYIDEALQVYRRHPASYTYASPGAGPNRSRWSRLLDGSFGVSWSTRCASETARLLDILNLSLLSDAEREFVTALLCYYRSGLEAGYRWRSFKSGVKVSKFFVTRQRPIDRCRVALRGLVASAPAPKMTARSASA